MKIFESLENLNVSEECLSNIVSLVEEYINEISDDFIAKRRIPAKEERDRKIIRHGKTMSCENPKGDEELLKLRQDAIDRLDKFDKHVKRYKELKKEGKIKGLKKD